MLRWRTSGINAGTGEADMRRVVVTGMGIVSSIGNNTQEVLASLYEAKPGISRAEKYAELGFRSQVQGAPTLDTDGMIDRRAMRFLAQGGVWNHIAMEQAIRDSGLEPSDVSNERTGIIMGSGGPSTRTIVEGADIARTKGPCEKAIKDAGAFLVPTMVTYEAIYREGKRYGIGDHQIAKIDLARQQSVQGLEYAYRAGCQIGSGSDLLGDMAAQRAVEFELKGQVMKPMEVLLSATRVNAELFRMSDRIGSVEPNKYADLIVVQGNPLKNLRVFQVQDNLRVIMKGGRLYKRMA